MACFFLGLWLAGGLFMAVVATQSFHEVDRLLSHNDPAATLRYQPLGAQARPLMRFQASEFNRWMFQSWEYAQLALGAAFFFLMLFWSQESKLVLGGILVMLALTAAQRFVLTPEIVGLGRELDFAATGVLNAERSQFWIAHGAYSGVELAKWAMALLLVGSLIFSNRRSGRSRHSRDELDRIDKPYHRSVNR